VLRCSGPSLPLLAAEEAQPRSHMASARRARALRRRKLHVTLDVHRIGKDASRITRTRQAGRRERRFQARPFLFSRNK
jgi:hypothetical protein